ncbi:hypothetical protein IW261DRAFT_1571565 [Armillaria novae-zelandiae]|uniref:DUF6534 domain-containing protein n=1 Tax=Armillaria novae-zelandiae TaxID=153914 RepID=A0AA39NUL2_9AGAR|nr:hypothetical protein IW261DRAFT_1571565 [Armillaria novae-zelandiae]
MPLQPSAASPTIGDTLGALYIGSVLAAVLFGITNLQVVIYYKKYPNDWWFYRYSVALLWVLDTLHIVLSSHAIYFYLIDKYGDLVGALESNNLSMKLQLDVNVVIAVYVQGLYAIRLWKFGAHLHRILQWFVLLAVAASLGASIFVIYDITVVPNLISVSTIKTGIYTFSGTLAATDVIIALTMSYYLHKSKMTTVFSSTAGLIFGLMRLVLTSGLATSACSILTLITFIVLPESLIFLGIHFTLSKFYVNSLLAMLNYRREKRVKSPDTERAGQSLSAILQFTPDCFKRTASEANVSIALTEIQDTSTLDSKLNSPKGTIDSEGLN